MAMLHLANLIEDAFPVGPIWRWEDIRSQLRLKVVQYAADGVLHSGSVDRQYWYFVLAGKIYRIEPAMVPIC